ncbi:glucose-6-phosphate isomerase [Leucobacter weissii]|uniref:Glucose-6-phosphate isomerase n=1 Tax=Leucobacter weissii TaxID=1983706 RepID=A0A939MQ08_9MICO|nr:glucose-6-phosphate isomerase [Leucobacter weissii]MBO1902602.1 glucose-6-phosphate isomerase [Leucobacter weissii]
MTATVRLEPGRAFDAGRRIDELVRDRAASRLFSRDATLWGAEAEAESSRRLGWVDPLPLADALVPELDRLRERLNSLGQDRVVLCGMGGSSLGPEVIARRDDAPLVLLDSTHPDDVRAALRELDRTVVVVSSKSGSTVETRSQLAAFESAFAAAGIDAGGRVIVVTDPDSALHEHALQNGYRVFLADPTVGGRYSALTPFGLVPSVLAGADGAELLDEARAVLPALRADTPENPAIALAGALASRLPQRYAALTFEDPAKSIGLAAWIEQLVAESTGKQGLGLLPIEVPADAPELTDGLPSSAFAVDLSDGRAGTIAADETIRVLAPLGAQFVLWETATALLGRLVGVNPFDQPDVESAKAAARALLADAGSDGRATPSLTPEEVAAELRARVEEHGYVAIQAYVSRAAGAPLARLRARLSETLRVPVALGFGPRYLHSTGQFHKGGPALGVFLQIVDASATELAIPGSDAGFGALIAAQARGDRAVLEGNGRPVLVLDRNDAEALLAAW